VGICQCICVVAQTKPAVTKQHEIVLHTDNDAYLLQIRDGYYSSGIFLHYNTATYNKKKQKTISSWQLNHKIFSPQGRRYYAQFGIDRPFAGYLDIGYAKKIFTTNTSLLSYGLHVGTIGPNAQAKPVQDFIHNLMGFRTFSGWENQINNQATVQLQAQYVTQIFASKKNSWATIHPYAKTNMGNAFMHIESGAYFTIGKLEQLFTSGLLQAYAESNNSNKKHKAEWLFFCQPQFMYQWHNATIQGGLFKHTETGVTRTLQNYVFTQTWGFMYNSQRFGMHVGVTYQSKETEQQDRPQRFGTLGFSVRW
jgi:lipid A 3-O-deacylase